MKSNTVICKKLSGCIWVLGFKAQGARFDGMVGALARLGDDRLC